MVVLLVLTIEESRDDGLHSVCMDVDKGAKQENEMVLKGDFDISKDAPSGVEITRTYTWDFTNFTCAQVWDRNCNTCNTRCEMQGTGW